MLSFLSRIFEKLMCARLDSHLKSNNILCPNQFCFWKNSNTSGAIIKFLNFVHSSLDSKQSTIASKQSTIASKQSTIAFKKFWFFNSTQLIMAYWFVIFCIMASVVSFRPSLSLIWVILNNKFQSITAVPFRQTLQKVFHKGWCSAQYFVLCIPMTCIDH